jgi:homoprotocatechuate degradation regulator HpaR
MKRRPVDRRPDTRPGSLRGFSKSLPMMLLRAREAVMRHFRVSLRRHGVTEQQWRVLRALSDVDEIEVSDLARRTYLLAPSLSRILPDMERRRLIVRRSDATDLRKGLIALSRQGAALIAAVSPESEEVYALIARRFGATNLAELQRLLVDLEQAMAPGTTGDDPVAGRKDRPTGRRPKR